MPKAKAAQPTTEATSTIISVDVDAAIPRAPRAELKRFQRDLKTLSKEDEETLAQGMLDDGFFVPVFVWRNWILDGHQRLLVLDRRGWELDGDVPIVPINARSKQHAAKRLLRISSQFGKIEPAGLADFGTAMRVDLSTFTSFEFAGFDFEAFKGEHLGEWQNFEPSTEDQQRLDQQRTHTCPKCGNRFKSGDEPKD